MAEFYQKTSKFLNLKSSKEALQKVQEPAKNDDKGKAKQGEDKKRGKKSKIEEKWDANPKKNAMAQLIIKHLYSKYTNYHALNTPIDHISKRTCL